MTKCSEFLFSSKRLQIEIPFSLHFKEKQLSQKKQADLLFPPHFKDDFPVAMQVIIARNTFTEMRSQASMDIFFNFKFVENFNSGNLGFLKCHV